MPSSSPSPRTPKVRTNLDIIKDINGQLSQLTETNDLEYVQTLVTKRLSQVTAPAVPTAPTPAPPAGD